MNDRANEWMDMLALFFTSLTDLHTLPKSAKTTGSLDVCTHQWETDKGQQSLPPASLSLQMPIEYLAEGKCKR